MAHLAARRTCQLHLVGRLSGKSATAAGNAHALGPERRQSPPREGPALLQGLVICGICGERMKVVYHVRGGRRVPDYLCDGRTVDDPQPVCQWISGSDVDSAVSEVLVEIMR